MLTDIEIAQANKSLPIKEIAKEVNLNEEDLIPYGHDKAKINHQALEKLKDNKKGRLILVTSINPTPAGEGKSTLTIGLGDALRRLDKKTMIALREPSLGPTMGLKGGAAGGGYAQVVPMEDINLHFTGDLHAITQANNLLSAIIDNHIQQGNQLGIDSRRITWKRVMDMNDRVLRHIVVGLGSPGNGYVREDGFDITVSSEIMAILCLSRNLDELRQRFDKIVIGYTRDQEAVTVKDLGCSGAMALLMKDAILPNLVQTLEHTPALIHGGPFANIAHGCNSVIATDTALRLADYVITEAGFGADLGAEKFMDIKVPILEKSPDAVVIVATARALKHHGNPDLDKNAALEEKLEAVRKGFANLGRHIQIMKSYQVPVLVAINHFKDDTDEEIELIKELCQKEETPSYLADVWEKGGQGALDLGQAVIDSIDGEQNTHFQPLYQADEMSIEEKIQVINQKIYGGEGVEYSAEAKKQLAAIKKNGWDHLPVCMAKTQYSLSDDPKLLGAPENFTLHIRELVPKLGAGFIVALTGNVLTMPGLPKQPAALKMSIDNQGKISGLF